MIVAWLQLLGFSAGDPVVKTLTEPGDNLCLDVMTNALALNVVTNALALNVETDDLSIDFIDGRLFVCR